MEHDDEGTDCNKTRRHRNRNYDQIKLTDPEQYDHIQLLNEKIGIVRGYHRINKESIGHFLVPFSLVAVVGLYFEDPVFQVPNRWHILATAAVIGIVVSLMCNTARRYLIHVHENGLAITDENSNASDILNMTDGEGKQLRNWSTVKRHGAWELCVFESKAIPKTYYTSDDALISYLTTMQHRVRTNMNRSNTPLLTYDVSSSPLNNKRNKLQLPPPMNASTNSDVCGAPEFSPRNSERPMVLQDEEMRDDSD